MTLCYLNKISLNQAGERLSSRVKTFFDFSGCYIITPCTLCCERKQPILSWWNKPVFRLYSFRIPEWNIIWANLWILRFPVVKNNNFFALLPSCCDTLFPIYFLSYVLRASVFRPSCVFVLRVFAECLQCHGAAALLSQSFLWRGLKNKHLYFGKAIKLTI